MKPASTSVPHWAFPRRERCDRTAAPGQRRVVRDEDQNDHSANNELRLAALVPGWEVSSTTSTAARRYHRPSPGQALAAWDVTKDAISSAGVRDPATILRRIPHAHTAHERHHDLSDGHCRVHQP